MALSYITYSGNGAQTAFALPFEYLSAANVTAEVGGVAAAGSASGGIFTFTVAPVAGTNNIRIERNTNQATRVVDFSQGSTLTEEDLDNAIKQPFFLAQEYTDTLGELSAGTVVDNSITAAKIVNGVVSNAKLANMARYAVKGRSTVGTGVPEDVDVNDLSLIADGTMVRRDLSARFADVFNVKDFGAVGNSIADDTTAIRAAILAAAAANVVGSGAGVGAARATVLFPPGVYRVTGTLTFDPFINYRGHRATTANSTGDFTVANDSRGSVIRADPAIYTANVATAGVLVFIPTGDISIRDIIFVGTAAIVANPSVGFQWGSSAASGVGTRPHETLAPMNVSGVDIQGCRFVAFVKAWEWNQVNDTYVSGCGFESNTTEISHNRRECDAVFSACTFFAFVIHLTDSVNATECQVRYYGCTWYTTLATSSAWVLTQDHAVDIEVHGGPVRCVSKMLDLRTRVDTYATRARFFGVRWQGASGGGLQIERFSGGTAFDYDVEFNGCQFDACVVTLNIASRVGFVGCRFAGSRILGSSNNPWLRIVGCIFRDLTGAAPVTIPQDSPYLVMLGNQFDACTTAPSLSTHASNTDWAVDYNSTSQATDVPVVRGSGGYASGAGTPVAVLFPRFIGQDYLDTTANDWWRSFGVAANTEWKKLTP